MKPFIFGERSGIHIIDLDKTMSMMQRTLDQVRDLAARNATILFVGTKKQAAETVRKYAEACDSPFVTNRWLGGTFTNWSEVSNLVRRYHRLKEDKDSGALARKYTKKEQLKFSRELEELEGKVGGIKDMKRLPDAVFIVDCKKEKTAVRESRTKGIPIIALMDTNVNPEHVAYGIPSNDDAVKTIDMMVRLVSEAIAEGKANPVQAPAAAGKQEATSPKAPEARVGQPKEAAATEASAA
ncbi:30S ribosomal protein S2, partial [Patescibacteria group bacterium]